MTHDELLEQLPEGPWRWEQVTPEPHPVVREEPGPTGWGLVSREGAWVLTVDSGMGSPDVYPREFGVDPDSAVARALTLVPDLVAEREDLWIALDEVVDLLRRFDAGDPPWPETARDIVRVLGDLCERLAGQGGGTTPSAGGSVVGPSGETATDDRARPGAAERCAELHQNIDAGVGDDDWVDDYGTGMVRPDLEAMYDTAPAQWREVLWWAWSLEGRLHEVELALGQEVAPTAGEVLDAARTGDEDAQRIVEAARVEGERRLAERVEELRAAWEGRERLDHARATAAARLRLREASWLDMLDAYTAELGLSDDATVGELRRRLRERHSPGG